MGDYIPDYTELHAMHEAKLEEKIRKYPKCDLCGQYITDDQFYDIDGNYFHKECLDIEYLKDTDDYMED